VYESRPARCVSSRRRVKGEEQLQQDEELLGPPSIKIYTGGSEIPVEPEAPVRELDDAEACGTFADPLPPAVVLA